jgi:hypothetical protein
MADMTIAPAALQYEMYGETFTISSESYTKINECLNKIEELMPEIENDIISALFICSVGSPFMKIARLNNTAAGHGMWGLWKTNLVGTTGSGQYFADHEAYMKAVEKALIWQHRETCVTRRLKELLGKPSDTKIIIKKMFCGQGNDSHYKNFQLESEVTL